MNRRSTLGAAGVITVVAGGGVLTWAVVVGASAGQANVVLAVAALALVFCALILRFPVIGAEIRQSTFDELPGRDAFRAIQSGWMGVLLLAALALWSICAVVASIIAVS